MNTANSTSAPCRCRIRVKAIPTNIISSHELRAAWLGKILLATRTTEGLFFVCQSLAISAIASSHTEVVREWLQRGFPHDDGTFEFRSQDVEVVEDPAEERLIAA